MKTFLPPSPCADRRESIACLAAGEAAVLAPTDDELRRHLRACPGCRAYFEEMSGVARALGNDASALGTDPAGPRLPESVYRDVARTIRGRHTSRSWAISWPIPMGAIALAAAFVVGWVGIFWMSRPLGSPQPGPSVDTREYEVPAAARIMAQASADEGAVGTSDASLGAFRSWLNRVDADPERLSFVSRPAGSRSSALPFRPGGAGRRFDELD